MKKISRLFAALFLCCSFCYAYEIPSSILARYKLIVHLVQENNAGQLAALVAYPLKREKPLPAIKNPQEFMAQYAIIFDEALRRKLATYADTLVIEHHGSYGLVGGVFHGDIWLNEAGNITAINYLSAEESKRKAALTANSRGLVHASVREWIENVRVGRSKNLIIRVDRTEKGLRYASWSKGRTMAEQPDLILYNGVEEAKGTMGGWSWTFKNGNWTYIVDDVEQCETDDLCGLFLRLYFNNLEKNTIRLDEIK